MEKEVWIEKVLNSAGELSKKEPSNEVWLSIQDAFRKTKEQVFSRKEVLALAASLALLIAVNLTLLSQYSSSIERNEKSILKKELDSNFQDNIYGEL